MKRRVTAVAVLLAAMVMQAGDGAPDPREAAIVETALAFWRKGAFMQYDSSLLTVDGESNMLPGVTIRMSSGLPPEEATRDRTVYTVCTSFAMEVYRQAIGWDQGGWPKCVTAAVATNVPAETIVFRQDNLRHPERRLAAMDELRGMLRPGDELVAFAPEKWGHAMLYVGDVDGDGRADVIHSSGRKYNYAKGFDMPEIGGNIYKADAEDIFFSRASDVCLEGMDRYFVIRPTRLPSDRYPITPAAAARLKYPGLSIERTVSGGCYGSVPEGGGLTYTIEIRNCGTRSHRSVPVEEPVPAGTEFVSADASGRLDRGTVSWKADVPAGAAVKLHLSVRIVAQRGAQIVSRGGNVGGIPSNVLATDVQGPDLRYGDVVRLRGSDWRAAVVQSGVKGVAFAEAVYRDVFGRKVQTPDFEGTLRALERGETPRGCVRGWFGGRRVLTAPDAVRVHECRAEDLKPGDVVFCGTRPAEDTQADAYVWTGVEVLIPRNGTIEEPGSPEVEALLAKDWFFAWRPTLL